MARSRRAMGDFPPIEAMAISISSNESTGRASTRSLERCGNATRAATSSSITFVSLIRRENVLTAAKRSSRVASEIFHRPSSSRQSAIVSLVTSARDSILVSLTSHRRKNITPRSYARTVFALHPRLFITSMNRRIARSHSFLIRIIVLLLALAQKRATCAAREARGRPFDGRVVVRVGERRGQGGDPNFFHLARARVAS